MTPITSEWLEKAEGDLRTASRELAVLREPNYDAVCFHSQQCAEKYLKARLQECGIPFGKTHHLIALLDLLVAQDKTWDVLRSAAQGLSTFAVEIRYPGTSADHDIVVDALSLCQTIRTHVRISLGLDI